MNTVATATDPSVFRPPWIPKPTIWSRLSCSARDPSLALGHQVQVRDALWFLARQWQAGEFNGFDGGSPVNAAYNLQQSMMTAFKPWPATAATALAAAQMPLEIKVEAESVVLGLRGSMQLGLRFEALLAALSTQALDDIAAARTAFPIDATPPASEVPDPSGIILRGAIAGNITDGWKLYQAAMASPQLPSIASFLATNPSAALAVTQFSQYCQSLYTAPQPSSAWDAQDLQFEFTGAVQTAATAQAAASSVGLTAQNFPGGELDWYSFDYASTADTANNAQPVISFVQNVIPQRISFPGMPGNKWWEFEDSNSDFGSLDTEAVDLTKMLVQQFAAVCANDWLQFSIPIQLGALNRLAALVVTDTFGIRTLIEPTASLDPPSGGKVWQMFTLSNDPTRRDTLLLPPVLGRVFDGEWLEQVLFFRDDMAAMCWAVEQTLAGPMDNPRNAFEAQRAPIPTPSPATLPAGVNVNWILGTTVPLNWIPLVPFTASDQTLKLRRGAMLAPNGAGGTMQVKPKGVILTPNKMFLVRDQAIPRAGVQANRYMRRTRWSDGSVYCWMARRVQPGRGQGASGLAFDKLETPAPA
jgi:hypothetical protein